jgi:hypothetical protein
MPKPTAKPRGSGKGTVLFDDTDDTPWHARNGGKEQGTPSTGLQKGKRAPPATIGT